MSEEKKAIVEDTEFVGKKDTVINLIASDLSQFKKEFQEKKDSLKTTDAIALAEKILDLSEYLIEISGGKIEGYEFLDPVYNPNFPPLNYPANFYFLDTAETVTKNEIVDPRINEDELKAVAFAPDCKPICFFHGSGRALSYVIEKHKKPMEEMALKMNFTPEQMDKIKKRIIFGPEMNLFSLTLFSDEIIKNLPENHPAWKKENKEKMDSLFMDIFLLPQTAPDSSWVRCMDADDNSAFWNFDETILANWYRENELPCPAILSAFASKGEKGKIIMPTGEKVRVWDETKQAWVVVWPENDPRMLRDSQIIANFIKNNKLENVYRTSQVRTAFNQEILDENGQVFGKGTSAHKAGLYFSKITGIPYIAISANAKSVGDSDTDSLMSEAMNCGFVLVDSKTNPSQRTAYYMVGKAKPGFNGVDVTYEFLKRSLKWLNINPKE